MQWWVDHNSFSFVNVYYVNWFFIFLTLSLELKQLYCLYIYYTVWNIHIKRLSLKKSRTMFLISHAFFKNNERNGDFFFHKYDKLIAFI